MKNIWGRRGAPCALKIISDGNPCFGVRGGNLFSTEQGICLVLKFRKEDKNEKFKKLT